MSREIRIPRDTVNDDVVTIQEWHRRHGDAVRSSDLIVSIESSKTVLEIDAETDGYLEVVKPAGSQAQVGEVIGRIVGEAVKAAASVVAAPAPPAERSSMNGAVSHAAAPVDEAAASISKRALALIEKHQIDVAAAFPGRGMIREADVLDYLKRQAAEVGTGGESPVEAADQGASTPVVAEAAPKVHPANAQRGMFADARRSASDRGGRSLLWLGWNYFWRNWLLGNLVRVAPRGIILALHRLRGVKIGRDVFIDPGAVIETAYPENISIGNDVRITTGVIVMTHIKAPNYLRDTGLVPAVLKPVVFEDHCFIGVNAVIMPGVTVGKASVVTSGSVVIGDVPPFTVVQGNPARVVRRLAAPEKVS